MIAYVGGIEMVLHAMSAHPKATLVQENGCWALRVLAQDEDTKVKIASLGGIETALHAMSAHPKATEVQDSGCFALASLAINKDNRG